MIVPARLSPASWSSSAAWRARQSPIPASYHKSANRSLLAVCCIICHDWLQATSYRQPPHSSLSAVSATAVEVCLSSSISARRFKWCVCQSTLRDILLMGNSEIYCSLLSSIILFTTTAAASKVAYPVTGSIVGYPSLMGP